jgi:D-cysteine desulfhydrase
VARLILIFITTLGFLASLHALTSPCLETDFRPTNIDALKKSKALFQNSEESKNLALFKAFTGLHKKLAYIELGQLPTPVQRLEKLEKAISFENIFIKRDDLTSPQSEDGSSLFGGNKVRKLEFLLADALRAEAETIVTLGAAGSNHALATAIYSQLLGLDCIIMLTPQQNASYVKRNLLLDLYYNPEIKAYETDAQRQVDIIKTSREYILNDKKSPYLIPVGGSNEIGAIGYVNAAFELKQQIKNGDLPEPDLIYVTAGSCGTASGLILGIKAAGLKSKVVAVRISGSHESKVKLITDLTTATNKYLNYLDPSFPIFEIKEGADFEVNDNFAGEKYAEITVDAAAAIKLLNLSENIKLDGTYTGKTFAALLSDVKTKKELQNKNILFIDTYCSGDFEELTKTANYKNLPELLQLYFKVPLQTLDQGC